MSHSERIRETVSGIPDPDYFAQRAAAGWVLVGLTWERQSEHPQPPPRLHEVPFGFRIAPDCGHLEEHPDEKRALTAMMEVIVEDRPLSEVAGELNSRGFRTRAGSAWTPVDVFQLLPRLVENGPSIFGSTEWHALKQRSAAESH